VCIVNVDGFLAQQEYSKPTPVFCSTQGNMNDTLHKSRSKLGLNGLLDVNKKFDGRSTTRTWAAIASTVRNLTGGHVCVGANVLEDYLPCCFSLKQLSNKAECPAADPSG
jgi:hypothetical protein